MGAEKVLNTDALERRLRLLEETIVNLLEGRILPGKAGGIYFQGLVDKARADVHEDRKIFWNT